MTVEPRETMRVLPAALQPLLTWLTGMPLDDERPLFLWTSWWRLAWTVSVLLLGLAIGAVALAVPWWATAPLLVLSWLLTTGAMRMLYVVIEHICTHGIFSRWLPGNRIVAEAISTLLWATPFEIFRRDHRLHHSATRMPTDPDVHFILATGYRMGMTSREFWSYFAGTLISPRFHAGYFWSRLRLNFVAAAPYRVALSVAYAATLLAALAGTGLWLEWAVLWLVPVSVLFQASSLINYLSEHRWPTGDKPGRAEKARLSFGRFCGEAAPAGGLASWSVWWLRLLLVHLPYRLFVLVGDLPQHDLHHRRPGADWANAAFARRDDAAAGSRSRSERYCHVWGSMVDHLRASLEDPGAAIAEAPSEVPQAEGGTRNLAWN